MLKNAIKPTPKNLNFGSLSSGQMVYLGLHLRKEIPLSLKKLI